MVSYLADLMEDATDFSWQGAKAAHAVLMCEMERGTVKWEDGDRIDRIRRAHAQKHVSHTRKNWARQDNKKPWFCKTSKTIPVVLQTSMRPMASCINIFALIA